MPEESRKSAKKTRAGGKKAIDSADSEKGLQVSQQFSEAQGTVEIIPPQHGGQNKIEITPRIIARTEKYAGIGLSNNQIAAALEMSKETLRLKCISHPELALAIERGRAIGINNVASRIYAKATEEDNLAAQMFFLERRGGWNKKEEIELSAPGGGPVELENKWTIEIIQPQLPGKKEEEEK